MKKLVYLLFLLGPCLNTTAQYSQYQLDDSTATEYPYHLPIMGKKVHALGFDIPKPVGIMLNYFVAAQDVLIPDISVGFKGQNVDVGLTDVTDLIEFGEINSVVHSINVRPDVWILPFLNVYGIFGKAYANTDVRIDGLVGPSGEITPLGLTARSELEGNSFGFGTTGAFGLGKLFMVLDGNWVWTNMSNFENPVRSAVFSFRLGKAFKIGKNPESNIALWAGGMRIHMGNTTAGTILMDDLITQDSWDRRDEIVSSYWDWYGDLRPIADAGKIFIADNYLTPIVDALDAADGSGEIAYSIEKEPKQAWNLIVGGQYQINKSWQIRAEGGILGNRKSGLLSLNYRFGL